jgi:RNA polymerase sigma-70 factor (ECF subfamily)
MFAPMPDPSHSIDADPARSFQATRRSLVARLKNWDDQASWRQFLDTYARLIYRVAVRAGLTDAEAQDTVQETIISVAKSMPGFKYDPSVCSFKTWLHHLALKRIADQFRKRPPTHALSGRSASGTATRTATVERIPDPHSLDLDEVWTTEWQQNLFAVAVERVKRLASVEQFQIFDLYVLRNWPVKRVVATLGVSPAQVYLAKHRVMGLVKRERRRLEKEGI